MRKNSGLILLQNIVIFLCCAMLLAAAAATAGRSLRIHRDSLDFQKALYLCEIYVPEPDSFTEEGRYEIRNTAVHLNDNLKAREVFAVDGTDNSIICSLLIFEKQE